MAELSIPAMYFVIGIYLLIGMLVVISSSKWDKEKNIPFVVMVMVSIFWLPMMFLCFFVVMKQRIGKKITKDMIITALKEEMKRNAWKN